jgi:pectinesterase
MSAPGLSPINLRIAADGSAPFSAIGEAIASIPALCGQSGHNRQAGDLPVLIDIGPGIYHEKIAVWRPGLTLRGAGRNRTILRWDDHATRLLPSGEAMNTFNTATLYIGASDFRMEHMTVENSAGDGRVAGQAIACYADADRCAFVDCGFDGMQDTLLLGPLPCNPLPKGLNLLHPVCIATAASGEVESGCKAGPQFRHFFSRCVISGDVDFIFGSSCAFFEDCLIESRRTEGQAGGAPRQGFVTAASTLPGQRHGFVFRRCRLKGDAPEGSVFLGRPWRSSAKVAFLECEMGSHIAPEGWNDWDNPDNRTKAQFSEWKNAGPGAAKNWGRVGWMRKLGDAEAALLERDRVLAGQDAWSP